MVNKKSPTTEVDGRIKVHGHRCEVYLHLGPA